MVGMMPRTKVAGLCAKYYWIMRERNLTISCNSSEKRNIIWPTNLTKKFTIKREVWDVRVIILIAHGHWQFLKCHDSLIVFLWGGIESCFWIKEQGYLLSSLQSNGPWNFTGKSWNQLANDLRGVGTSLVLVLCI